MLIRLVIGGSTLPHYRHLFDRRAYRERTRKSRTACARLRRRQDKWGARGLSFTIKEVRRQERYIAQHGPPDGGPASSATRTCCRPAARHRDTPSNAPKHKRSSAIASPRPTGVARPRNLLSLQAGRPKSSAATSTSRANFLETTQKAQAQRQKPTKSNHTCISRWTTEAVHCATVEREAQVKVQAAESPRREKN